MDCEGNGMSEERITQAIIRQVLEEQLRTLSLVDVPAFLPSQVMSVQEQAVVNNVAEMFSKLHRFFVEDSELQDTIDAVACVSASNLEVFNQVAFRVFEHGITWERIAVLLYVAGKLAVKRYSYDQSIAEFELCVRNFFRNHLLGWIQERGGWENCILDLMISSATTAMRRIPIKRYLLAFTGGLAIVSFIIWRLTRP